MTLNLLRYGADLNVVYPEDSHDDKRNGLKIVEIKRDATSSQQKRKKSRNSNTSNETEAGAKRNYRCTVMINYA